MSPLSRRIGWTLVGASLLLHIFTVYCFARQPDRFAAFTVMPIWLWGGVGLLWSSMAFYFLRAPLSLVMSAVWAITLLVGADEARVLPEALEKWSVELLGQVEPEYIELPGWNRELRSMRRINALNAGWLLQAMGVHKMPLSAKLSRLLPSAKHGATNVFG